MNDEVKRDLKNSSYDFKRLVWPVLRDVFGGGTLYMVETETSVALASCLDKYGGIDAFHIKDDSGIRGIASRVQYINEGGKTYKSFTTRMTRSTGAETEFAKRFRAIKSGKHWIYPGITTQAYVEKPPRTGKLLYLCGVNTKDLIEYIASGNGERRETKSDGNTFAVSYVLGLRSFGIKVFEHEP